MLFQRQHLSALSEDIVAPALGEVLELYTSHLLPLSTPLAISHENKVGDTHLNLLNTSKGGKRMRR